MTLLLPIRRRAVVTTWLRKFKHRIMDPLGYSILGRAVDPFEGGAIESRSTLFIESGNGV